MELAEGWDDAAAATAGVVLAPATATYVAVNLAAIGRFEESDRLAAAAARHPESAAALPIEAIRRAYHDSPRGRLEQVHAGLRAAAEELHRFDPGWRAHIGHPAAGSKATIVVPAGSGTVRGTPGRDVIVGTNGPDRIVAGAGGDVICANGGNDRVRGGDGDDRLSGGKGNDRLSGGDGDDRIIGGSGNDRLYGRGGDDLLLARDGLRDLVNGGQGNDTLRIDRIDITRPY